MKIAVLDGNSLMNRAFYGIRLLTNRDGVATNALLGFMNMVFKLREETDAEGIIVCFDRREPTFRHLRYDGYKATRHPMPEELAQQMPIIRELLDLMQVPRLELAGYEADDLLGTVAAMNAARGGTTVVVTGDRDSLQLVSDQTAVHICATSGGKPEVRRYDEARIREDYGVSPKQLIQVKALMGDSSDNIPGVPGVGEKTALALIARYGSVDGVYAGLDAPDLKPALRAKLEAGKDSAYLSLELAEICCAAPIEVDLDSARWPEDRGGGLYERLSELELRSVITRLGATPTKGETPAQTLEYTEDGAPDLTAPTAFWLSEEGAAVCDGRETRLLGLEETVRYLTSPAPKVGFEVKNAARFLLERGLEPPEFAGDVQLMGFLLGDGGEYEEIADHRGYASPAGEEEGLFAMMDDPSRLQRKAAVIYALWQPMERELRERGMEELYTRAELPLAAVLARMEHAGIRLDAGKLAAFGDSLAADMQAAEERIYAEAGHTFNPNSPKQLGEVLFEELHLPGGRKTSRGYSTDADVLEKLRDQPIVAAVLDYRKMAKLRSTYVDSLLKCIGPDGRVHTHFHQTGTVTGRLSASDPNMQNMPIRRDLGGEVRACFLPREGYAFADADYSQIELRVLAHLSGDEAMRGAFAAGEDIHTITAAGVFGVPEAEVTPQMRSSAKAVNFGIVYGISDFSLAEDIHVSRKEAGEYIRRYFEKYPKVAEYMENTVAAAKKSGTVTTMFGRTRPVRDINASNFNLRSAAERIVRNTPIQGTAADIIKLAMVRVDQSLRREFPEARMLLQVHDELLVEAPREQIEAVRDLLVREMESAVELTVRLTAQGTVGDNWLECK